MSNRTNQTSGEFVCYVYMYVSNWYFLFWERFLEDIFWIPIVITNVSNKLTTRPAKDKLFYGHLTGAHLLRAPAAH